MTSVPFDLPTLRNHYGHFAINNKQIPILYRLKSGVYYPYIAFDLVVNELNTYCSTWNSSKKLPLLPMTINEIQLYKTLYPKKDFSLSSKLILCSLIDQYLQLLQLLQDSKTSTTTENIQEKFFARFTIDIDYGSIREIDIINSEATTKYNNLRSTIFPSMQAVKRQLCFDDEKCDLSSIGGYLQLDRCIYPYIITSSDILLNLNDLRKPFNSTLNTLMPYFHSQPLNLINNYMKIIEYGTRYIKKYKYYYKNVDEKFISLYQLLLSHREFFFVQLFNSNKISLTDLHEYYRSDFSNLLTNNLSDCGYLNNQPCINGWSLYDSILNHERKSRLATKDEIILINWLFIYDNKSIYVHNQLNDLILVKQQLSLIKEKMKFIQNEHIKKRSILMNHNMN
ncbi:unnamed protein product [Adineta steineri]|uniref:Uncharacterized protein n=1 Tax=Adineta steineri TaxID=433720 RepID=A0A814VWF1_9BILA|nr:unnamed protein product [Adineta steineri]CAF1609883.1 unnamed protein product [Adineta steineri]